MSDTASTVLPIGFLQSLPLAIDPKLQVSLLKEGLSVASAQGRVLNRVAHPIIYENAAKMMLSVDIQQTCIQTKRDATVGLGFESKSEIEARAKAKEMANAPPAPGKPDSPVTKAERSKVSEILDPLCKQSFQAVLNQCGEDYENTGVAYMEVVRDGSSVAHISHHRSHPVYVYNEQKKPFFHYEVDDISGIVKYARHGDLEDMKRRNGISPDKQITELIAFVQPTSFSAEYGLPSWLAVIPWLEMAQMMLGCHFDFFQNRAVPDLLAIISGGQLSADTIKSLTDQIKATVGQGNRHKTLLMNLPHPDMKAQIERLESNKTDTFESLWGTVQLKIVSSHRVPPLLAGLTLPGKMAAANELPNALVAFQNLYVQQHQTVFETMLRRTLGEDFPELKDEFNLKKITDCYDMGQLDTMARMRQTATGASAQGRNLGDGLKQ